MLPLKAPSFGAKRLRMCDDVLIPATSQYKRRSRPSRAPALGMKDDLRERDFAASLGGHIREMGVSRQLEGHDYPVRSVIGRDARMKRLTWLVYTLAGTLGRCEPFGIPPRSP
jgi:hypothetical protein